jgi:Xaa-Pro aminopeptidase
MNIRVNSLLSKMNEADINGVVIGDSLKRRYLSNFTGSSGYLYISNNKKVLLTDFRYLEQAASQSPDFEIVDYLKKGLVETLEELIREDNIKTLGFEDSKITYKEFINFQDGLLDVEFVELNDLVEEIRMIKDETELENIKIAASIGDKAFNHILDIVKPGITEIEVALEIEYVMKKNGASKLSFDTIVASGVRSSLPHAEPTNKKIEMGDFVKCDFGCVYNGYCSDMTRTIVMGKANDKQKEIYNTVLKAQKEALNVLRAGLRGCDVDSVARDVISEAGYKDNFGHGLGHSVGLFIHESPRLSPKDETVLQENMIVTVEPGIYVPNFGGVRIEDLVCVTKDGHINYVNSPKELIEL